MNDIEVVTLKVDGRDIAKMAELSSQLLILEKAGASGIIRVLPRTFEDRNKALEYLGTIDESLKNSTNLKLRKSPFQYFVVLATEISFLT